MGISNRSFEIERFTKKGREIIRGAVSCAGNWGHTYIGSEHILLSILEEGTSTANSILLKHGVIFEDIQEQIMRIIGKGTPCRLTQNDFTPTAINAHAVFAKTAEENRLDLNIFLPQCFINPVHVL